MSAVLTTAERRRAAPQWAAATCGLALLAGRLYLRDVPLGGAVVLPVLYSSLFLVSMAEPASWSRAPVQVIVALGVGLLAVSLAGTVSGPSIPAPGATVTALLLTTPAAIAEEAFFRRFLYARFERWGPAVAIVVTAVLFAAIHAPLYGVAALPLDLGAGLLFGWQRWASGTWTVPAATHVFANWLVMLR